MDNLHTLFRHFITSTKFTSNNHTYYDEGIMLDVFLAIEHTAFAVSDEATAVNFMGEFYMMIRKFAKKDRAFEDAIISAGIIPADDMMNEQNLFEDTEVD